MTLTPFPEAIAKTIDEALRVLHEFRHGNFTEQELAEAKVPYLGRFFSWFFRYLPSPLTEFTTQEWMSTKMKEPSFWMGLMEYLQLPKGIFPPGTMSLSCLENIYEAYAAVDLSGT